MAQPHAEEISKHVRTYVTVFVALMGLTLITVAIAYLHLSVPMGIAVALLIASIKGTLVACYFMHLISERRLVFVVLVFTAIFFVGLLLLPVFTSMDLPES
jgi:cytochrome c oxidase subunit 4